MKLGSHLLILVVEWAPDVLVSDIGMPDEDGDVLIRKVRAREAETGGRIPPSR
jgi:CheY-like chemotaxis protein